MEPTSNLQISLPDSMLAEVDRLARERGVRRVNVIREAVAAFIANVDANDLSRQMQAYVDEMSDLSDEFVAENDVQRVEHLLRETEW